MPPPLHKLGWSHISLTQDWSLLIQLWANKILATDYNAECQLYIIIIFNAWDVKLLQAVVVNN